MYADTAARAVRLLLDRVLITLLQAVSGCGIRHRLRHFSPGSCGHDLPGCIHMRLPAKTSHAIMQGHMIFRFAAGR